MQKGVYNVQGMPGGNLIILNNVAHTMEEHVRDPNV